MIRPNITEWARKHQKAITVLYQIALLSLVTYVAALYVLNAGEAAGEEMAVKSPVAQVVRQKAQSSTPAPKTPVIAKSSQPRNSMEQMILDIAIEMGYKAPRFAVAIAKCESGLNPNAKGDGGKSWGLWQIHQPSHPEVGAKAFDPEWSTRWAMKHLIAGHASMWTCARILAAK